ncbi:hypothetical protein AKO1_005498 [Acrasis kona]|uniref:Uncharacterized protein n=1 Tax=Acrasis kona TaxID=1008807 RepID=A0AAW2YJU5_9EUKA
MDKHTDKRRTRPQTNSDSEESEDVITSTYTELTSRTTSYGKKMRTRNDVNCDASEPSVLIGSDPQPSEEMETLKKLNYMILSESDMKRELENLEKVMLHKQLKIEKRLFP